MGNGKLLSLRTLPAPKLQAVDRGNLPWCSIQHIRENGNHLWLTTQIIRYVCAEISASVLILHSRQQLAGTLTSTVLPFLLCCCFLLRSHPLLFLCYWTTVVQFSPATCWPTEPEPAVVNSDWSGMEVTFIMVRIFDWVPDATLPRY